MNTKRSTGKGTAASTHTQQEKVETFFEKNYNSLSKFCHSRWNGRGDDVLHSAFVIAKQRYKKINFSLFTKITREAARSICNGWMHDDEHTIILPPTSLAGERLAKVLAVADDDFYVEDDIVAFLRKDALFTRIIKENREATQEEAVELRKRCETRPVQVTLF